ncbi:MAG: hypothetical protein ACRBCL_09530 [Maritimibacter sp.]
MKNFVKNRPVFGAALVMSALSLSGCAITPHFDAFNDTGDQIDALGGQTPVNDMPSGVGTATYEGQALGAIWDDTTTNDYYYSGDATVNVDFANPISGVSGQITNLQGHGPNSPAAANQNQNCFYCITTYEGVATGTIQLAGGAISGSDILDLQYDSQGMTIDGEAVGLTGFMDGAFHGSNGGNPPQGIKLEDNVNTQANVGSTSYPNHVLYINALD